MNPSDPRASPRILVVDDDPIVIKLMGNLLAPVGKVSFATSGTDALALVHKMPPDLILLDADMPGMDGFETCTRLKGNPEYADLPILFVTALADNDSEERALRLGAVDFIHKPIHPAIVRARVRTHLALKQKSDELKRLVAVDGLTHVANRRAFDEALEREWQRAARTSAPLSLIMIDVDFFKSFNDHYGHPQGDECLRAVARTLSDTARRPADLLARYGGEEFAALLPETGRKQAVALAARMCEQVRALHIPHARSAAAGEVTVSIGVACMETHGPQAHWLVAAADQALYAAKAAGRNRVSEAAVTGAAP